MSIFLLLKTSAKVHFFLTTGLQSVSAEKMDFMEDFEEEQDKELLCAASDFSLADLENELSKLEERRVQLRKELQRIDEQKRQIHKIMQAKKQEMMYFQQKSQMQVCSSLLFHMKVPPPPIPLVKFILVCPLGTDIFVWLLVFF